MSRINNTFDITGFVGTDPEIRVLPNKGTKVASFPIAVDGSYKKRESGEVVDRTDWFDVEAYKEGLVEQVIEKFVRKGTRIRVRGSLHKQTWDSTNRVDAEGNPKKDSRIQLVISELQLLGAPKGEQAPSDLMDDDIPM